MDDIQSNFGRTLRHRFVIWSIVVAVLGIVFLWEVSRGIRIETNILELLPAAEQDPVVEHALRSFTSEVSQKMAFLVGHKDEKHALAAAEVFANALTKSGAFRSVLYRIKEEDQHAVFSLYFPYRYQLLSPSTQELLEKKDGGTRFMKKLARTLYSPLSVAFTGLLEQDPLLFFPEFIQSLSRPSGGETVFREGVLLTEKDGVTYVIIAATARKNPFARTSQHIVSAAIEQAKAQTMSVYADTKLVTTGVFSFAKETSDKMEREISTISVGSLVGILILVILVFRSLKQFLFSMAPMLVGMLAAFTLSFFVFPNLHLLTLVFGASLIGICVDYSFHYFTEQLLAPGTWRPETGLQNIFPGITLGAITSIMGYLGLLIAPFPGLRQMAVFSSIGLLGAYGTVVCWYPVWLKKAPCPRKPFFLSMISRYTTIWEHPSKTPWILVSLPILLTSIAYGLNNLNSNDDVSQLQQLPTELIANEKWVMKLTAGFDTGRFIIVEGETPDAVLEREETVINVLEKLCEEGALGSYQGISEVVPSKKQQKENRQLIQDRLLNPSGFLETHMASLGFAPQSVEKLTEQVSRPLEEYLTIDAWISSPVSIPLRHLWLGPTIRGFATVVLLGQVKGDNALENLENNFRGVHYVNQSKDFSELFRRYRVLASKLVVVSYIAIVLVLMIRYGAKRGTLVVLPPILAALSVLAYLGLSNQAVNLFNMLALLLVLGIGIDYTIFFAEAKTSQETIMLAVILSACTTILSFGLLSLSETPVLKAFGKTVLIGIGLSLLLAPLAQKREPR